MGSSLKVWCTNSDKFRMDLWHKKLISGLTYLLVGGCLQPQSASDQRLNDPSRLGPKKEIVDPNVDSSTEIDNPELYSGSDEDDGLADDPSNITGVFLTCSYVDQAADPNNETLGCNMMDGKTRSKIDPLTYGSSYQWSIDTDGSIAVEIESSEAASSVGWQVLYRFSKADGLNIATINQSTVRVNYHHNESNQNRHLESKISQMLKGLEAHRYLRLHYLSILGFGDSQGSALEKVEFLIDDKWTVMEASVNFIQVGEWECEFTGSLADKLLFGDAVGKVVSNWDGVGFSPEAPYDALAPNPYTTCDFGKKVNVKGFRFNHGKQTAGRRYRNSVPDYIYLEVSNDNVNYQFVPGSELTLEEMAQIIDQKWYR